MTFQLENIICYCNGGNDNVDVLFIMESPFVEELQFGIPCMGDTGSTMSKALKLGKDPLGKLLSERKTPKLAVFNTFNFALDTRVSVKLTGKYPPEDVYKFWTPLNIPWCGLKIQDMAIGQKLKREQHEKKRPYDRNAHYNSLWDYIANIDNNTKKIFLDEYKKILLPVISNKTFPNLKEIVVCGYIAQSIFTNVFDKQIFPFNRPFHIKKYPIPIRFLNHPSSSMQDGMEWSYHLP